MHPKIFVFDLDGTLTRSKTKITSSMGKIFSRLLVHEKVAVISGADIKQFSIQLLSGIPKNANLNNLYLLPVNGGELWEFKNKWRIVYRNLLSSRERKIIAQALCAAYQEFKPKKTYGRVIQNRGAQVTLSLLGADAPLSMKAQFDPKQKKRKKIVADFLRRTKGFSAVIGGTTSIDVVKKGMGKPFGIKKLIAYLHLKKQDVLFVGDAVYPQGNDYQVKQSGMRTQKVRGPLLTARIIKKFVSPPAKARSN
jgi:HAD superfamily hydrolase (TIGR01484 family)